MKRDGRGAPGAPPNRRGYLLHCSALALALTVPGLASAAAAKQAASAGPLILVLGDSLSAEYGLPRGQGWVALLEQRLAQQKRPQQLLNASISGDTTAGGRARLPALLQQRKPAIVIIELGGNDALRGLPLKSSEDNLLAMVKAAKAAGAKVLLLGMQLPPNYGASYGRDFAALYERVAQTEKVALVPFLLKGVADRPDAEAWFQADRIHPLARAHPQMLDNVWPALQPLL
ncbi:arylesterase [Roseateles violae]|uniref:Arylesterase n=1 Tax=Roseateles violae TaxID=3058042 RepID=A0ABT8DZ65_9BURK|nr:arylesterase [Pelomonas sp. PFR6]MDN3922865.1 arylesterase [Pelomonas sp. PFR6]